MTPTRSTQKKPVSKSAAAVITVDFDTPPTHFPKRLQCSPDSEVVFMVVNRDSSPQRVWVDIAKVATKSRLKKSQAHQWPRHPFSNSKPIAITVPGGEVGVMRRRVLASDAFPFLKEMKGRTIRYKYWIESESTKVKGVQQLDPDLDVTDPAGAAHG